MKSINRLYSKLVAFILLRNSLVHLSFKESSNLKIRFAYAKDSKNGIKHHYAYLSVHFVHLYSKYTYFEGKLIGIQNIKRKKNYKSTIKKKNILSLLFIE